MPGPYACIDVGTTTLKLNIYDDDLRRIQGEKVSVPVGEDGLQDAEELFRAVNGLFRRARDLGAKSAGLATYRASMVAWRKDGTPLTPIITWLNRDSVDVHRRLPGYIKLLGRIPPLDLVISPYSPIMKLLKLREVKPGLEKDLAEGRAMAWTVESYLVYRLTGRFVSDATNASLTGLIDPRNLKPVGIVKSIFRLNLEIPEIIGNTQSVGLAEGLELKSVIADQQAASVGEGAIEGAVVKVTNGTGTFVDVPVGGFTRRGELIPIVILRHESTTYFGVEGYLPASGRAVDLLIGQGKIRGYEDLEVEVAMGGPIVIPAVSGLQIPRIPWLRTMIVRPEGETDVKGIARGLLKSIAFHCRLVIETARSTVNELRADGGLSRSDSLLKFTSVATGLPVKRQADTEGTSRGLAFLQMMAEGRMAPKELQKRGEGVEISSESSDVSLEEEYRAWLREMKSLKNSTKYSRAE